MPVLYVYGIHRAHGSGDLHSRNGEQELHGLDLRREPALVLLDHIAGPEMRDSPRECDSTGLGPHPVDMLFTSTMVAEQTAMHDWMLGETLGLRLRPDDGLARTEDSTDRALSVAEI